MDFKLVAFLIHLFLIFQSSSAESSKVFREDTNYCSKIGTSHGENKLSCHVAPTDLFNKIASKNSDFCLKAFEISCIEAHEKVHCDKGTEVAKLQGNCNEQSNFSFKKCCKACKLGIEMKLIHGTCTTTSLALQNVITDCCHSTPYSALNDDETQPVNTDFSLCMEMPSLCDSETEICEDVVDDFRCICKPGYNKNLKSNKCEDVNECMNKSHNCKSYETCVNEKGSYRCEVFACPAGLEPKQIDGIEGYKCVDVDECLDRPCEREKICENTYGSYKCVQYDVLSSKSCEDGYKMINGNCVDVDECAEEMCDGYCTNLEGGYRCQKIECERDYTKSLSTMCRRRDCPTSDKKCQDLPLRISHFFKVIDSSERNMEIFKIVGPYSKIYKNFRPKKFNNELFGLKEYEKRTVIKMRSIPKDDEELIISFDVYDRNGNFKGIYEHIYHVYVNKSQR